MYDLLRKYPQGIPVGGSNREKGRIFAADAVQGLHPAEVTSALFCKKLWSVCYALLVPQLEARELVFMTFESSVIVKAPPHRNGKKDPSGSVKSPHTVHYIPFRYYVNSNIKFTICSLSSVALTTLLGPG